MWLVAKIKIKNLNTFKRDLIKKVGNDIEFYYPKIEYHRYCGDKVRRFEKYVLENYIFCYHEKFKKSNLVSEFKFLKGLEYFLKGSNENQTNIIQFIKYCKTFEDDKGYLTQSFFKMMITKKAKFISGPFTNMVFEILERQKNKIKILLGNVVTTISDKTDCLYRPI
jgi:hypothetical protein